MIAFSLRKSCRKQQAYVKIVVIKYRLGATIQTRFKSYTILKERKHYEILPSRLPNSSKRNRLYKRRKIAEELSLSRTSIWKAIKRLEQEGIEIDSIKNKGYKLMNGDLILPEILEENLQLKSVLNPKQNQHNWMQKKQLIQGMKQTPSIQLPIKQLAEAVFNVSFYSPQGGIYMTLHLKPNLPYTNYPPTHYLQQELFTKPLRT